jgi:hypothetical protein
MAVCSASGPVMLHWAVRIDLALSHLLALPLGDTLSFALLGAGVSSRAACIGGTTTFKSFVMAEPVVRY